MSIVESAPVMARPPRARAVETASIVLLGACGAYITVILPAIVKLLVEQVGISGTRAGYIVGAEKLGMMASSLGLSMVLTRLDRRRLAFAFLALLAGANALTASLPSFGVLCGLRFACGVSEGGVIALMTAVAAMRGTADRTFGMYLAVTLGLSMLGFDAMPSLLAHGGLAALFYAMAGVSLLAMASLPFQPSGEPAPRANVPREGGKRGARSYIALALLGTLLFEVCIGAVWNYIALIGTASRYSEADVSSGLAQAMIVGIVGGLLSSALGDRFGRALPIGLGVSAILASQLCLLLAPGEVPFVIVSMLFMAAWMFTLPFLVGAASTLDRSGRAAVLSIVVQTGGLMAGPVIAAEVIRGNDAYRGILWVGLGAAAGCFALILPATSRRARAAADASEPVTG